MTEKNSQDESIFQYPVPVKALNLKIEEIEKAMGYNQSNVPTFLKIELKDIYTTLFSFDDLCSGFKIITDKKFSIAENGFYLDEIFFHTGKVIAVNLTECEYIAVFVATAGNKISRKITDANQAKEYVRAYLYDAAGSEIVELTCDYIQNLVEKKAKEMGLAITNRYSPGYCGWSVAEQHQLFTLIPEGFCGITLNASALMVPIKSVSGIIGLGRRAAKKAYGCAICTLKNCYKRKQPK